MELEETQNKDEYIDEIDCSNIDSVRQMANEAIKEVIKKKVQSGELAVDQIEDYLAKLEERGIILEAFLNLIDDVASSSVEIIENIMYEKVLEKRAYANEFLARQEQKWGKAFVASEALYLCIIESTDHYEQFVCSEHVGEENHKYYALKYIHGRALQMYSEIVCLVQNGFADGAYARWRSLYELSIIASFIGKYGEQVAEDYIKSVGTYSRNEWARKAPCFANKKARAKISFKDLFENSGINESWNEEYQLTNLLVHGSADGTFHRFGQYGSTPVMSVGRSDWGMSPPAIHAAMSLVLVTCQFFSVYTHGDSMAAVSTFNKWISRIELRYKDVEEHCFPKDPDSLPFEIKGHGVVELDYSQDTP